MTGYDDKHGRTHLCWPPNMYINSSTTHSIDNNHIQQPKYTDVVISMLGALGQ